MKVSTKLSYETTQNMHWIKKGEKKQNVIAYIY